MLSIYRLILVLFISLTLVIAFFPRDYAISTMKTSSLSRDQIMKLHLSSFFSKQPSMDVDVMNLDKEAILSLRKGSLSSKAAIAGCWKVEKILPGKSPSWTKYSNIFGILNRNKNSNYQVFFEDGNFYNLSEYFGEYLCATAEGRYECVKSSHPSRILANINRICIRIAGREILSFRIDGQGVITVLFLSKNVRVFESEEGACVIQTKTEVPNIYNQVKERMIATKK